MAAPMAPLSRWAIAGGALLAAASAQFVIVMGLVELAYPGYDPISNYVSDLGNPAHSPWAILFNGSIRLLGVAGVLAAGMIGPSFLPSGWARAGRALLAITSAGAFLVGTFPEGSPELHGTIHGDVSDLTFLAAGLALLLLGAAMRGDPRWRGWGVPTVLLGVLTFLFIGLFVADGTVGLAGLLERGIIAPILLWAILAGAHLAGAPALVRGPARTRA